MQLLLRSHKKRGLGFRVYGLGFRNWGLGFGIWGLGFGVWDLGFGVWGMGFRVWSLGWFGGGSLGFGILTALGSKYTGPSSLGFGEAAPRREAELRPETPFKERESGPSTQTEP